MDDFKGTSTVVILPWHPCIDNMQIINVEKHMLVQFFRFDIVTIETHEKVQWINLPLMALIHFEKITTFETSVNINKIQKNKPSINGNFSIKDLRPIFHFFFTGHLTLSSLFGELFPKNPMYIDENLQWDGI